MGIFSKIIDRLRFNYIYLGLAVILTIVLISSFLGYLPSLGCPFSKFLNFCCPMCGTTRAWKSFLAGHLDVAFRYNPIFIVWGFWCAVAYLDLWCKVIKIKRQTIGERLLVTVSKNIILLRAHQLLSFCMLIYLNLPPVQQWRNLQM